MRRSLFLPLICTLGFSLKARAAIGVCGFYREVYQNEIKGKIQAGVPFEIMSTVFVDGQLVSKKAIRVAYNLWDEIVTLKTGEQELAHFALASAGAEICKYLEIDESLPSGRHSVYRLLLNPLWGERIARLQLASGGAVENSKIMNIHWQKLANEMPSDKVLLEKELAR